LKHLEGVSILGPLQDYSPSAILFCSDKTALSFLFQLGEYVLNKLLTACWQLSGPDSLLLPFYALVGSQIIKVQSSPLLNLINKNHNPRQFRLYFLIFVAF